MEHTRANKGTKDITWVNDHILFGKILEKILFNEKDDGKPNANLIASAPEMKKALEMVRDAWKNNEINFECDERNGTGYVGTHHLIKNTLDALAKAEGSE